MRKLIVVITLAAMFLTNVPSLACFTPKPKIISISPAKALNNGVVQVSIAGDKFVKETQVKLVKAGGTAISGGNLRLVSKTWIDCSFDLRGKAVGQWDVVVVNKSDKRTAVLAGGFTIEYPAPTVAKVDPGEAEEGAKVALALTGDLFRDGLRVELTQNGRAMAKATGVARQSAAKASCEFDLTGLSPGKYDLAVTNDDGKKATLTGGLTINTAPPAAPEPAPAQEAVVETPITAPVETPAPVEPAVVETPVEPPVEAPPPVRMEDHLGSIFYDFDRAVIRADQAADLRKVAEDVKAQPDLYVVLGGNADQRGQAEYNLRLSARRAEAVKAYLVQMGVDAAHIIVFAYGEDHPVKPGQNKAAWAYNRRVDITLWTGVPTQDQAIPGASPP